MAVALGGAALVLAGAWVGGQGTAPGSAAAGSAGTVHLVADVTLTPLPWVTAERAPLASKPDGSGGSDPGGGSSGAAGGTPKGAKPSSTGTDQSGTSPSGSGASGAKKSPAAGGTQPGGGAQASAGASSGGASGGSGGSGEGDQASGIMSLVQNFISGIMKLVGG